MNTGKLDYFVLKLHAVAIILFRKAVQLIPRLDDYFGFTRLSGKMIKFKRPILLRNALVLDLNIKYSSHESLGKF